MGWASANSIFDNVATSLVDANASPELKRSTLGRLIGILQQEDWDTEDESLDRFKDDPAIVAAFADNDVNIDSEEN